MDEAKISFNCFVEHEDGYGGQITIRGDEADEWGLLFDLVIDKLKKKGYKRSVRKNNGTPKRQANTADENGRLVIPVENIKLASGGEHPRWVVQGGNFKKFGITCWPEVLEAAGIMEHLDPVSDNNPQGNWQAVYVNKVGEDKPDKVILLEKL